VDVRTTKDGSLVCMHDADVSRTTDGKGKVRDLTLAEVQKLVRDHVSGRTLGLLGEPRVNVLELNRALDQLGAAR